MAGNMRHLDLTGLFVNSTQLQFYNMKETPSKFLTVSGSQSAYKV